MGRNNRHASSPGDDSGISLFDTAASGCAAEAAAEAVRVCARGGLGERDEPVAGTAVMDRCRLRVVVMSRKTQRSRVRHRGPSPRL